MVSQTTIYTVGLGASVDRTLLDSIATATGGAFFLASNAAGLDEAFKHVGGDLGAPDSDGDGLSDAAESAGWRDGAGHVYRTDPHNADTDGDGLTDGTEAGTLKTGGTFGVGTYYKTISDPTKIDTDNDGLDDAQELELGTRAKLANSDGDGISDIAEVDAGFDPLANNEDQDYGFDDTELADGSDPFGYDFSGLDLVHAGLAGFFFGDAWDSWAAKWAQVNVNVASAPAYLIGQTSAGLIAIGDLRDLLYDGWTGHWGDASWAAVGIIPIAGDALKSIKTVAKFAEKSTRAVRAAVEFVARKLPKRYVDDAIKVVGKLAAAQMAVDKAVRGLPAPSANYDIVRGTWTARRAARIGTDPVQASRLQEKLDELLKLRRDGAKVEDVRVNQRQVDISGKQVGINRPDLQYTLDGKRYYMEWDRPRCVDPMKSRRGDLHAERIFANDPSIDFATQVILVVAGTKVRVGPRSRDARMSDVTKSHGEERLLMGGRWLPVTATVNFLEADVETCAKMFVAVRGAKILELTGHRVKSCTVRGSLDDVLGSLLPLVTAMSNRDLFIPVHSADGQPWTAYVDNHHRGIEMGLALILFATRGIRGVSVSEWPNSYDRATNLGSWGQRKIEVLEPIPGQHDFTGYSLGVRVNDSARWEFIEPVTGTPFPDPTDHSARRVADRFTHDHLAAAAGWFGLRPFDEDFYAPERGAILVEDTSPRDPAWNEMTLEQAQANGRGVLWSHMEHGRVVELP